MVCAVQVAFDEGQRGGAERAGWCREGRLGKLLPGVHGEGVAEGDLWIPRGAARAMGGKVPKRQGGREGIQGGKSPGWQGVQGGIRSRVAGGPGWQEVQGGRSPGWQEVQGGRDLGWQGGRGSRVAGGFEWQGSWVAERQGVMGGRSPGWQGVKGGRRSRVAVTLSKS